MTDIALVNEQIPIKWYYLKSLSKIFDRKLTESEQYLEEQVDNENQTYMRTNDQLTLKKLRDFYPYLFGFAASVLSSGILLLHYKEVDKYYNKKAQELEIFKKSQPNAENLFPAKNMEGSSIPFKQISKFQQRLRILLCMGFFFAGGFANGYANYKYNLINMNDIYYSKQFENFQKKL